MPYSWTTSPNAAGGPLAQARLWPHRSLPRKGAVFFIATTFALILLPLIPLLGTPVLWGLLPFLMGAVWALYHAIMRSYRDGELLEELTLWSDRVALVRHNPRTPDQHWEANPHWVHVRLHESQGPVPNYVTLSGGGREVELGAFLSPTERAGLFRELQELLHPSPGAA